MRSTNIKNILAGVGAVSVVFVSIIIFLTSAGLDTSQLALTLSSRPSAKSTVPLKKVVTAKSPKGDPTGELLACNTNKYEQEFSISTSNIPNTSIEVDQANNVYMFIPGFPSKYNIKRYSLSDNRWKDWQKDEAGFSDLGGMTGTFFTPDGTLYVVGSDGLQREPKYLYIFSSDGKLLQKWDNVYATSVVASATNVYALSTNDPNFTGKAMLKKYDLEGNLLDIVQVPAEIVTTKLSSAPDLYKYVYWGANSFNVLTDMAIDKNGTVYIVVNNVSLVTNEQTYDRTRFRVIDNVRYKKVNAVLKFDSSLKRQSPDFFWQESEEKKYGESIPALEPAPSKIDIDKSGNVFLLVGLNTIQKYGSDGKLLTEWNTSKPWIFDIDLDKDGNLFVKSVSDFAKYSEVCGRIVVQKIAEPKSADVFTFTKNFLDSKNFTLVDDGKSGRDKTTFTIFKPAKDQWYSIKENKASRYYPPEITCIDPTNDSKVDKDKSEASVHLDGGAFEEVVCTFFNKKCPPGVLCDTHSPKTPDRDFEQ